MEQPELLMAVQEGMAMTAPMNIAGMAEVEVGVRVAGLAEQVGLAGHQALAQVAQVLGLPSAVLAELVLPVK